MVGRLAAVAAVAVAVVVVAVILLSGGTSYQVRLVFGDASQIVNGDQVQVAGNSVGSVSNITLTPNGQAQLTINISNPDYVPLHQGTEATVRLTSLSGIANRYVDLRLGSASAPKIPSGGVIGTQDTTSAVDIDELFNTLNPPTLKGLQNLIQGAGSQFAGKGAAAQAAWQYLNPAVAASSTLFSELNRHDGGDFTNFVVQSSKLLGTVAQRQSDLSALVKNLGTTTQALASQKTALGQSIQRLPQFMALADTTFVNLRNALDDLTPLVNVSKPVAPKLQKFLTQLRPLAQNAVPTVRDLANIICSRTSKPCSASNPGENDLIQLLELSVQLDRRHLRHRSGRERVQRNAPGQRPAAARRVPAVDDRAQRLDPRARDRSPVRGRPDRLVRGLQPPGDDRRERRREPDRAGRRRRLGREREPQPASVVPAAGAPAGPRVRRQRHRDRNRDQHELERSVDLRTRRPLPRIDGARRDLLSGNGLPVRPQRSSERELRGTSEAE